MPLYQIQAPNGQTYQIEGPEGASQQDVINAVLAQHPQAGQQVKEPGVLDRMGRGLESLLSSQRTAVESLGGGDYAKQSLARQQAIEQKYGGTDDWEAVKKAYEQKGLLSAAGEYLGRVPGALAEQAPQIAESAAAARLGAMAGPGGAAVGLVAPSYTQAYGTLLEREAAEQAKRGEAVDPSRLKAAALAVPYSAMDVAATLIPMGKGIVKTVFGEEVAKMLSRGATKEAELAAAKKITSEGFGRTLGVGLAKGAAFEIPSEVGQQMLERVQAGLPLLDQDAMEEYGKTAFSTSMLAPLGGVGRFSEKSAARGLLQDEEQRLSAERRAAEAKAEEERKATPEYARDIEQQYMEAEKQKQAMLAQVKKLDESSPTYESDRQANKVLHKQIEAFVNETLKPLAEQYNAVKPALAKMAEQERLGKLTPEDVVLDYLGVKMPEPGSVKPPAMRTVVDEFGRISEEPAEKPPTVSELAKYAAAQIQSARESGQFMADDYIGYLMNDPAKAAEIAKNRTPLPGLDKREASIVYDGLKLQLKERERQRAAETKATMEERAKLLKAPVLPDEEQKYDEIMDFAKESRELASEDMRHLDDTFVSALTTGQPVVDVSPDIQVTREAPRLRERIEELMAQADQADREYRTARAARERGAAAEAFDRARTAIKQLQALEESGGAYAKAFIGARRAQFEAMAKIEDVTDQLRSAQTLGGENKAMASSTEQSLSNEAARQRAAYITNVLQEAALHRRAQGLPALTHDEAIKASSKMYDTFNDWLERSKVQMPRDELTNAQKNLEPTRQRVNKNKQTISNYTLFDAETNGPAELTIIRQPDGTVFRVFASYPDGGRTEFDNKYDKRINDKAIIQKSFLDTEMFTLGRQIAPGQQRISPAEIRHFQERLNAVRSQLFERPETKLQTESPLLRTQFAGSEAEKVAEARGEKATTLGGELRRRTEYVRNKMVRMQLTPQNLGKSWLGTRNALNAAADVMDAGNATRDFLDAVEPVVDAVLGQRSVPPADLQAIRDAIAAARPTAVEQKEAGQKGLFPEIEEDLGYIRMTPANFAKSPKIKPVWEAIDRLRALAKAEASKQAVTKQRLQAGATTVERIQGAMDVIEKSTQFFMKHASRYSPMELAKALVPKVEAGKTPEERTLLDKYAKHPGELTEKERHEADRILYEYRTKHLPEYQQRLNEALIMLSKGEQIDALDNELYSHMAGVNKAQKEAAKAVQERVAVYKKAIADIEATLRASAVLTPEQRKVLDQQKNVQRARGDYQAAVEKAIAKSYAEMNKTLAELLDPEIAATEKIVDAARKTLAKEKAELDKIQKRVRAVLEQPEGKDRMQLATYEQFKYEEKAATIKDLAEKLAKEEEHLRNVYEARHDELESAQAVAMAMADKQVKEERHYLEIMERQLADMRGDKILDKPNLYPFSAQRMQANIDAQKAAVKTAETRAADIKERVKTDNEKVQEFVQNNNLPGLRRTGGVVEPLLTEEQKRAEKLRKEAENQYNTMTESERSAAVKQIQLNSVDEEISGLLVDFEALSDMPDTAEALRQILEADDTPAVTFNRAFTKLGMLDNLTALEAQRDTIAEGKPRRKQRAATAPTTIAQSAQIPFRTGNMSLEDFNAEDVREANKLAKQVLGTKAPTIPSPGPGRGKQPSVKGFWDEDLELSRGKPVQGLSIAELETELEKAFGESIFSRAGERKLTRLFDIYNTPEEFVQHNPEYAGSIPDDAKGFAHQNRAILFANNIGKGHGLGVFLHEVGVHIGFKNLFNAAQYNALVRTVKNWAARNDDSIEARIAQAAMARVEAAQTPEHQKSDEILAYAVEEALRAGVNPTGVKQGALQTWLKNVIDAFKRALAKFGVNPKNLTAGDLVNFAYGAAHLELKGTWHGTGVHFTEFDHAYMSTGEGNQAFSWGTYRGQKYGTAETYYYQELDKKTKAWRQRPDVAAWEESFAPEINGVKVNRIAQAGVAQQKLGLSRVEATVLRRAVKALMETHAKKGSNSFLSTRQMLDIELEFMADTANEFPAGTVDETVRGIQNLRDKFLRGDLVVTMPSKQPYYKGLQRTDFLNDELSAFKKTEGLAAYQVLVRMQQTDSDAPFAERVREALKYETDLYKLFAKHSPEQNDLDTLAGLRNLKVSDFFEIKETPPPVPKPVGFMLRTIHTRPEEEYLLWDKPIGAQSRYVQQKLEEMLAELPENARASIADWMRSEDTGANLYMAISAALEQQGMPDKLSDMFTSRMLHASGIAGTKFLERMSRAAGEGFYNYVDYGDKDEGAQIVAVNIKPVRFTPKGEAAAKQILLSRGATYANDDMRDVGAVADKFIARNKGTWENVKAAAGGWLGAETMLVDRFAGLEKLSKLMDPLKGSQMMFYARMYDQRMNFVAQAVEHGAPSIVEKIRRDGQTERLIEAKEGPNIKGVVNILKEANKYVGNGEAVNRIFTMYMSAIRAREKGFDSLHFGDNLTEADLKQAFNKVSSNPALKGIFDQARAEYNAYNRNLIDFLVQTGAISRGTAATLTANNDYIPWYRERNGVAEMIIGNEPPVRIGSIAEQPYLHQLVGGDAPILDFLTSSVQNTNMIADMGLRNLATKNAVFEMVDLGAAKIVKSGTGPNVVKFRDNGEEKVAEVSGLPGIPGDLIVKGMEGIPTQMPAIVRAMSVPSRLLRKAVTLSPLYMAKQLFRDSLAAPIVSGANFTPIVGALKEIGSTTKSTLERRGIVGGQQFTGTTEDITKILRDLAGDKTHWMAGLAKAEAMGMEADALTRRAQYNSYIEQGLSEMEATLLALESMNFNKRGASPSIHWVNAMIPFFNAQIQGLNVLYKALTGKMPFNDRLKIQEKLLQRGAMLAGATFLYAAAMQDDEAYKNATPDQKYGNWFVRIPGVDEPVKIPVPFEIGYLFKALPEALYNSMVNEHGGEEAVKAFQQILLQTIPGGTSYGLPQAIKPGVEAIMGKSFYTGRDILSEHEKRFLPSEQYRDNTTEIAKIIGKVGNVSPVMLEELVRGYTGTMGLAFLQAVSMPFTKQGPEAAARRLSDLPVVGGAFQPNDAGGVINNVYEHMKEAQKVENTYKKMLEEGRQAEANALVMTRGNEFVQAQMADWFTSQMGEITKYERAIRAMNIPADEKRRQLDELRQVKIQLSNTVREVADKTKLQGTLL